MKTYVIIKDGTLYRSALKNNEKGFTEKEIKCLRQKNKSFLDDSQIICIEEENEKYQLTNSEKNEFKFEESVYSFFVWKKEYYNNNLNGFTIPMNAKDNSEYQQKLKCVLKSYMEYLNRPAFVYEKGLLDDVKQEIDLIIKALDYLINNDIAKADKLMRKMLDLFRNDSFLISDLDNSYSFRGMAPFQDLHQDLHNERSNEKYKTMMDTDLTFFRVRTKDKNDRKKEICKIEDILHLPFNLKDKSKSMRFSVAGSPGLYLSVNTYTCSQECNWNSQDEDLYASVFIPNEKGKKLKILNLTISEALINGIYNRARDTDNTRRHKLQVSMLKIFPLVMATSFSVDTEEKIKYQYLLSQALMRVATDCGIDGIAYFSMKGEDEFEFPQGVNLVIPATDISDRNLYSKKCQGFEISKPILYCKQNGGKIKSYINEIYKKYDDLKMESFTAKMNVDGVMQFYGETCYGKFDDFLTTYLKTHESTNF